MIVADQVKKIKDDLYQREKSAQKDKTQFLMKDEYNERCQTIHNIGPTMNDVVKYCHEDGWDQEAVCTLIFKVVFGEEWDFDLEWF